jgi:hypothetical protein
LNGGRLHSHIAPQAQFIRGGVEGGVDGLIDGVFEDLAELSPEEVFVGFPGELFRIYESAELLNRGRDSIFRLGENRVDAGPRSGGGIWAGWFHIKKSYLPMKTASPQTATMPRMIPITIAIAA